MLARYGITLPQFAEYIRVCLAGEAVSQVYEQGKTFNLTVRVDDSERDRASRIADLMIDTGDGSQVPLSYVAHIRSDMGRTPSAVRT